MNLPIGRQNFISEINQPEAKIDLGKAAFYIAQEEYPQLDVEEYLNALDTMAEDIKERLPEPPYPLKIIQTVNQYLYDDLGFQGNTENYYDPGNSYLNQVIEKRTGIPITLSLVYLEIAKRLDFPMVGIGMPGHFLIRPEFEDTGIFVDAFHQGEVLFAQDCEARLAEIYQRPVQMRSEFLEAVTARQFLARMLTNLKQIYLQRREFSKSLATVERIILLYPDNIMVKRDRAFLNYQLGNPKSAIADLQAYLKELPYAQDADIIRKLILEITTQL